MSDGAESAGSLAGVIGLQTLRRYWLVCVTSIAAAVGLAAVYLSIASPVYEAEVRVVIQQLGLGLDGTAGKKTYDREFLSTQAELIRSPLVVSQALREVPPLVPPQPEDDPVAAVLKDLRVSPLANTDIIRVTYQNADSHQAMKQLRAILDSYQGHLRQAERASSSESFALLQEREKELRNRLQSLQQELTQVRGEMPAAGPGADAIEDERALLKELTSRWATVRAEKAWLAAVARQSPQSMAYPLDVSGSSSVSPLVREVTDLQDRLTVARAEYEEASLIYGERHPERVARGGGVAVLEKQLAGLRRQLTGEFEQRRTKLAAEEQALQTLVEQERDRLQAFDTALQADERLLAEIERVSELHRSSLASLEAVGMADRAIADGRASISVRVIDDYVIPQEPVWPQPIPLLGASAMLGLLLSLGGIVLLEMLWTPAGPHSLNTARAAGDGKHSVEQALPASELEAACARDVNDLREMVSSQAGTAGSTQPVAGGSGATA